MFDIGELVRQTDRVHTLNVSYLYYLNRIKGKRINEMSRNYTGNEQSHAVKLCTAVLGVVDITMHMYMPHQAFSYVFTQNQCLPGKPL